MLGLFLEFRMKQITDAGKNAGIKVKHKRNMIRWKLRSSFLFSIHEMEGSVYDIYPVGIYQDPDTDINLRTLIVKAVYRNDPTVEIYTQIGGFVPRVSSTGLITEIPLHVTTNMEELNPFEETIDNIGPMEGGIQAELNGYSAWTGPTDALAEAVLEINVVHEPYHYIPFQCPKYKNITFAVIDSTGAYAIDSSGKYVTTVRPIDVSGQRFKEDKDVATTTCSRNS
jgi:hypothetical protein